ncbi:MAG: threonylcarbamoyl-AMP synthase [Bacteroidetes bacterium]|nr:threonylcarbamoyl-AMP synthase [Bacteroidota bacterium]
MKTRISKHIDSAIELLTNNQLVAIPTETVYGLAGNALNPETVLHIYEVKKRPHFDPLIVHTDSIEKIKSYVHEIPLIIHELAQKYSPGPLTFVLPKNDRIPDLVSSGLDSIAVRIPDHPMTLDLLSALDFPLAAPSANLFGKISPTSAQHVYNQLNGKIPLILDGGDCSIGIESTIVSWKNNKLEVLRLGGITIEQLKNIAGEENIHALKNDQITAPGQLKSHYTTQTPLIIGDLPSLIEKHKDSKIAVLSFCKKYDQLENQFVLSPHADLHEAAQNLFKAMHALDALKMDFILTEVFPNTGLGLAINDRLARASFRD